MPHGTVLGVIPRSTVYLILQPYHVKQDVGLLQWPFHPNPSSNPIKTLVARQWPTNNYYYEATYNSDNSFIHASFEFHYMLALNEAITVTILYIR